MFNERGYDKDRETEHHEKRDEAGVLHPVCTNTFCEVARGRRVSFICREGSQK